MSWSKAEPDQDMTGGTGVVKDPVDYGQQNDAKRQYFLGSATWKTWAEDMPR